MIRVLIVDDSLFIRTILRDLLKDSPEIEIVGTAVNGIDALAKIADLKPDVVTLDIEMPRMNGLEVLEALRKERVRPKVIVLSTLTSRQADMTHRALRLGADDFMLKPRDVPNVRGIERELIQKIKNLVSLPVIVRSSEVQKGKADAVVLIGSSAGGPPMLDAVLSALPADLPAAVVVTQHMPEGFTASLAERLNRVSPLPVRETANGDTLQTGTVLIAKAGYHTVISGVYAGAQKTAGRVVHSTAPPLHAVRPAVDMTFTSAARVFGPRTVSVILSGMGSDGGEGMLALKNAGGSTMVCAEEDCLVYGMARSALARNCVDRVVPLKNLASEIARAVSRL
ncbi:MAG TPA: chemotaxis-specific protein-glutamate methyltransferase CheB [Methanoculleus sp.]|uniref:chemotaxis-specific protein-glutamate methyltransferase CheB n=1 Tax=Methanoculleus sp. TaxID=90427 RepID=UPI002BF939CC|nr:chemotaxis-specific protein-glutamate methyltransferase CheB [Methanoculleus sp.]HNT07471.1 chemotaxis-specific protein-glutamate methyltransferase CheB [Methanoculleus sp.]HOS67456.1 chemotaxis-specific protein-glutamate methyltransferase CheB [Methanoculleus sp.]HQL59442.1 chemotaxis-specific protein-glutamate methyltransferase CheB [Methanoculleus sp.]